MQDSELPGTEGTEAAEAAAKRIEVQKIYVKDISYEAPGTPQVFTEQWAPKVSQEMANSHVQLSDSVYEAILTITITVSIGDKVAYLAELKQAGIFNIIAHPPEGIEKALAVFCPTLLFPYAREAISDLSGRGGFPSLILQHINFNAMYHDYLKKKEAAQVKDGGDFISH